MLRISIKNSVDLERDPVLGTKTLSLKDLFEDQDDKVKLLSFFFYSFAIFKILFSFLFHQQYKEVQKWIPLANGIGFGKFLLSVKCKPVKMTLPKELQGSGT